MHAPGSTDLCFYYLSLDLGEILVFPISHFDLAHESHFLKAVISLNAEDRGVSKAGKLWFCSCLVLLESWGREKRKYKETISLNIVFQRQSYSDIR